uniref:Uncharacterized protein n=1 Tax=Anguilla anguilla TaxID=7936 RepID=A0A0E9WMS7_ANGAN
MPWVYFFIRESSATFSSSRRDKRTSRIESCQWTGHSNCGTNRKLALALSGTELFTEESRIFPKEGTPGLAAFCTISKRGRKKTKKGKKSQAVFFILLSRNLTDDTRTGITAFACLPYILNK